MSFKKTYGSLWREPFRTPLFKTNLEYFSFLNIAIKILNFFLYDDLDLLSFMFLIIFIKKLSIFVLSKFKHLALEFKNSNLIVYTYDFYAYLIIFPTFMILSNSELKYK